MLVRRYLTLSAPSEHHLPRNIQNALCIRQVDQSLEVFDGFLQDVHPALWALRVRTGTALALEAFAAARRRERAEVLERRCMVVGNPEEDVSRSFSPLQKNLEGHMTPPSRPESRRGK